MATPEHSWCSLAPAAQKKVGAPSRYAEPSTFFCPRHSLSPGLATTKVAKKSAAARRRREGEEEAPRWSPRDNEMSETAALKLCRETRDFDEILVCLSHTAAKVACTAHTPGDRDHLWYFISVLPA